MIIGASDDEREDVDDEADDVIEMDDDGRDEFSSCPGTWSWLSHSTGGNGTFLADGDEHTDDDAKAANDAGLDD